MRVKDQRNRARGSVHADRLEIVLAGRVRLTDRSTWSPVLGDLLLPVGHRHLILQGLGGRLTLG